MVVVGGGSRGVAGCDARWQAAYDRQEPLRFITRAARKIEERNVASGGSKVELLRGSEHR